MNNKYYKQQFFDKNKLNFCFTILFGLGRVGINIYMAFIIMILVDISVIGTMQELINKLLMTVAVVAVNITMAYIERTFKQKFIYTATVNYKSFIFKKLLNMNSTIFNENTTSKYTSALSNDINSIEVNYLEGLPEIINNILLLLGGLGAMFYLNAYLTAAVIITSMLPVFVSVLYGNKISKAEHKVSVKNEQFIATLRDIFSGFAVIKSFKADKEIVNVYNVSNTSIEKEKKVKRTLLSTVDILSEASGFFVIIAVFAIGAALSINGIITAGTAVAFIQLLNNVIGPINLLPTQFAKLNAAKTLTAKIEGVLDIPSRTGDIDIREFQSEITFENVTFGYDQENPIITGLNLSFEAGKSYAIIGASGSGKSTVIKLMQGYYTNYQGKIVIDGSEVLDIQPEALYDLFSVIQQNVFIFNSSIKDNITMYKEFDSEKISRAIDLAELDKLILEKGETYICGENGDRLSGGEKQRISIARSLLSNASVLLMDEATAALDSETTFQIEQSILNIKGKTKVIITHKMNEKILPQYDRIIVLKNGSVIEEGSFEELIARKEYFYSLYKIEN